MNRRQPHGRVAGGSHSPSQERSDPYQDDPLGTLALLAEAVETVCTLRDLLSQKHVDAIRQAIPVLSTGTSRQDRSARPAPSAPSLSDVDLSADLAAHLQIMKDFRDEVLADPGSNDTDKNKCLSQVTSAISSLVRHQKDVVALEDRHRLKEAVLAAFKGQPQELKDRFLGTLAALTDPT